VGSVSYYNDMVGKYGDMVKPLCCVADYPANKVLYANLFSGLLHYGMSDHTIGLDLYHKYTPEIFEKHYALEDSVGPDAAEFSIRPEMLKEIL
jgi:sialic acid synthase SpsE